MDENRTASKKSWGRFLIKYAVILLAIGLAACVTLYCYAAQYEETRPELVIEEMMNSTSRNEWFSLLKDNLPVESFIFEDAEELFSEYYKATLSNADFSFRKDMVISSKDETVFVVYTGPVKICNVYLSAIPGTRTVFGRSQWELDRVETLDFRDYLETFTVRIDAPANAEVAVNGVMLSDEYITESSLACPKLTELESRFPVQPSFVRYEIEKLCGSVRVSRGDKEIMPDGGIVKGVAAYTVDPEGCYSVKIEAPEDIRVSVCGLELSQEDSTSAGDDIFKGLDKYAQDAYKTLVYEYDGLYSVPEISALAPNGKELEPIVDLNGVCRFFYPSDDPVPDGAESAAKDFFEYYMDYSSSSLDHNAMNRLLKTILPDTELSRYIIYSASAMYWAADTEVKYNELVIDNFHSVNENCFTCTISYSADFTASSWHEQYSYDMQNGYKMVFVRYNKEWRAASMYAF